MPVIKVWCLPEVEETKLNELHQAIVAAVVGIEELRLKDENDMTCLFPSDMMKYGLGLEIIVEVTGLFEKPERTANVHERLAWHLGMAVQRQFPKAKVECFVYPFDPAQGFWRSGDANLVIEQNVHTPSKPPSINVRGPWMGSYKFELIQPAVLTPEEIQTLLELVPQGKAWRCLKQLLVAEGNYPRSRMHDTERQKINKVLLKPLEGRYYYLITGASTDELFATQLWEVKPA